MQGSNFGHEAGNPGQQVPPPQSIEMGLPPQPEDPLGAVLRHLQASLNDVQTVQERVLRQRHELDVVRAEVVTVSEMERSRIGRDLHDVVGQILTAIAFLGKTLEHRLRDRGLQEAADARQICDLASEAMRQARSLARGLCTLKVTADELVHRLSVLAADTQRTFRMGCHLVIPQELLSIPDDAVATNLYCIAQESVTNAVKHGKARNVHIRLGTDDGSLVLAVQDDGIGFRRTDVPDGIGLRIMGHRAGLLGGTLRIESRPGAGTSVTCAVPINRPAGRSADRV